MSEGDVPDSTDWLSTPLSALAAVESALRCQVCKDFYTTPMITSCSHTFCSLCIRRALSNDGKCPLCRASEQELKLRSNWSVEEAVEAFVKARTTTLALARSGDDKSSLSKRKAPDAHPASHDAPEGKRLRTSARLRNTRIENPATDSVPDDIQPSDDDAYPEIQTHPNLDDGFVSCPVCERRMKDWQVFKHLEACPGPESPPQKRNGDSGSGTSFNNFQGQKPKALERLPALNYSMYKEQALRKKMSEIGISSQGSRSLIEKRHKEWMTIWNANCDAARPKKRADLLQDLDVWERTQGGRAPVTGRSVQNAAIIKDKDFDGGAWAAKHDSSFKDLIASARKSRLEAKGKTTGPDTRSSTGVPVVAKPCLPSLPPVALPTTLHANDTESLTRPLVMPTEIKQPFSQPQLDPAQPYECWSLSDPPSTSNSNPAYRFHEASYYAEWEPQRGAEASRKPEPQVPLPDRWNPGSADVDQFRDRNMPPAARTGHLGPPNEQQ
ncbi:hypothetical protein G7046_g3905 [Stylonectria norvegica]|nr:hypothetical protein G7046_g3905 [Stylonectria norvegica]